MVAARRRGTPSSFRIADSAHPDLSEDYMNPVIASLQRGDSERQKSLLLRESRQQQYIYNISTRKSYHDTQTTWCSRSSTRNHSTTRPYESCRPLHSKHWLQTLRIVLVFPDHDHSGGSDINEVVYTALDVKPGDLESCKEHSLILCMIFIFFPDQED